MKTIIDGQVTVSRPLEGPLTPHVASFAQWMSEQGYSSYSLQRHVRLASDFSRWLEQNGVPLPDLSSLHPQQYLRHRARKVRIGSGDAPALRYLLAFLHRAEVIPAVEEPAAATTPVECCVEEFERYLREERALASATLVNYLPFVRELLTQRFGSSDVPLSELCASDVVGFVQRRAHQPHIKRATLMATALRSFLNYARYRGDITLDLAAAIPPVANWSMKSIPRAIADDQVHALLASIDRSTVMGRRD